MCNAGCRVPLDVLNDPVIFVGDSAVCAIRHLFVKIVCRQKDRYCEKNGNTNYPTSFLVFFEVQVGSVYIFRGVTCDNAQELVVMDLGLFNVYTQDLFAF